MSRRLSCFLWVGTGLLLGLPAWAQEGPPAPDEVAPDTEEVGPAAADAAPKTPLPDDDEDGAGPPPDISPELTEKPIGHVVVDTAIDRVRTPVDRLTEQYIGSASRAVGFDYRDSWFQLAVIGSELIERNNFGSFRIGGLLRKSFLDVMFEGAVTYVYVMPTESSRLLALTPYVQAGRPTRIEFDVNISYPLFEGAVTPLFDFLPRAELVFAATAGGRYLLYPRAVIGDRDWSQPNTWTQQSTWREIGTGLGTVQLNEDDQLFIERSMPGGMLLDPARVHTLVGFTFDGYIQPGAFVSFRPMLAVPVLATVSGTQLGFWWEISLAVGYAF